MRILVRLLIVSLFLGILSIGSALHAQSQSQPLADTQRSPQGVSVPSDESANERVADYTFALTVVTSVLAVATIGLGIFNGLLWGETRRGGQLAREAMITDKRAFVFASNLTPVYERGEDGQFNWRFIVHWQNSGDTPTKNLRAYAQCDCPNNAMPANFDFSYEAIAPGRGFIGPKSTQFHTPVPWMMAAAISPQDIADAMSGKKFIYVWGSVRYSDVFERTDERLTRVAWQILPSGNPFTF
jgi:hypothetical protein